MVKQTWMCVSARKREGEKYYYILFIHSAFAGHLGWFHAVIVMEHALYFDDYCVPAFVTDSQKEQMYTNSFLE